MLWLRVQRSLEDVGQPLVGARLDLDLVGLLAELGLSHGYVLHRCAAGTIGDLRPVLHR